MIRDIRDVRDALLKALETECNRLGVTHPTRDGEWPFSWESRRTIDGSTEFLITVVIPDVLIR